MTDVPTNSRGDDSGGEAPKLAELVDLITDATGQLSAINLKLDPWLEDNECEEPIHGIVSGVKDLLWDAIDQLEEAIDQLEGAGEV